MNFNEIRADNKRLMMAYHQCDLNTAEGRAKQQEISQKLQSNNSDLRGIAAALGDEEPRLLRKNTTNYGHK